MARSMRHTRWVFILVPDTKGVQETELVKSLRSYCRLAMIEGLLPVCPALWWRLFTSPGELDKVLKKQAPYELGLCDRIWVHQPLCEPELTLDYFSYQLLAGNNRDRRPRPVFGLKPRWRDGVQYHEPYRMSKDDLTELMLLHLDVGLIRTL